MSVVTTVHRPVLVDVYADYGMIMCYYVGDSTMQLALLEFDTGLYYYIPCIMMLTSNVIILIGIFRGSRIQEKMAAIAATSRKKMTSQRSDTKDRKALFNLLVVSTTYVVLMTPNAALWIYYVVKTNTSSSTPGSIELLLKIAGFCDVISLSNYCFNFVIYGCTLPFYQVEVWNIFCCACNHGK
jgi:hypothetical protein